MAIQTNPVQCLAVSKYLSHDGRGSLVERFRQAQRFGSIAATLVSNPSGEEPQAPQQSSFSKTSVSSPTSQLILQPFRRFTYVTTHSPALLSLLLRHRFSLTSPGEPPMISCQSLCTFFRHLLYTELYSFYIDVSDK